VQVYFLGAFAFKILSFASLHLHFSIWITLKKPGIRSFNITFSCFHLNYLEKPGISPFNFNFSSQLLNRKIPNIHSFKLFLKNRELATLILIFPLNY
jgi:hypothetical protein